MSYILFVDAGHAWLEVPVQELKELRIDKKISGYSYEKSGNVYLEEDCDLAIFVEAKVEAVLRPAAASILINHESWFKENVFAKWEGDNSRIRNYKHYKGEM